MVYFGALLKTALLHVFTTKDQKTASSPKSIFQGPEGQKKLSANRITEKGHLYGWDFFFRSSGCRFLIGEIEKKEFGISNSCPSLFLLFPQKSASETWFPRWKTGVRFPKRLLSQSCYQSVFGIISCFGLWPKKTPRAFLPFLYWVLKKENLFYQKATLSPYHFHSHGALSSESRAQIAKAMKPWKGIFSDSIAQNGG